MLFKFRNTSKDQVIATWLSSQLQKKILTESALDLGWFKSVNLIKMLHIKINKSMIKIRKMTSMNGYTNYK